MLSSHRTHSATASGADGEALSRPRGEGAAPWRSCVALATLLLLLLPAPLMAQSVDELSAAADAEEIADEEASEGSLFQVQRIDVHLFGGYTGGDTYLELPPVTSPLTSDTASDEILDFSGNPAEDLGLAEAPEKELEPGWRVGTQATFYLSEAFGMFFRGQVGRTDAVLTGQRGLDQPREEFDRATVTTYQGGAGAIYHIGRARKFTTVRPYVNLAFSGILHSFESIDDVSELSFSVGGGVTFPLSDSFRGQFGVNAQLFSWETEEVSLDETLLIPEVTLGVIWRYDVPERTEEEPPDEG